MSTYMWLSGLQTSNRSGSSDSQSCVYRNGDAAKPPTKKTDCSFVSACDPTSGRILTETFGFA